VPLARPKEARGVTATRAGDGDGGGPVAAASGDGHGREEDAARAAWRDDGGDAIR
jgi:hypothetical protein